MHGEHLQLAVLRRPGDDDSEPDDLGPQAQKSTDLYRSYLSTSGLKLHMQARKLNLFRHFASAEASPECMTNYGDNDPEWSRASQAPMI